MEVGGAAEGAFVIRESRLTFIMREREERDEECETKSYEKEDV